MRHPSSSAKKEDDLSRLTSSSSSSRDRSIIYPIDLQTITSDFNSTYLPNVIDQLDWQISRKRKERQDSTSSITQDRKFVRSNSEEYIPNLECEVIRRVLSHEEFKNTSIDDNNNTNNNNNITNNNNNINNINNNNNDNGNNNDNNTDDNNKNYTDDVLKETTNNEVQEILKGTYKRTDTSPARSHTFDYSNKYRLSPHRLSPHRDNKQNGAAIKFVHDDTDGEHERRRSSERFCKARATPGRKAISSKRSNNKHFVTKFREKDDIVYKYDINNLQYERRGFMSTKNNNNYYNNNNNIKQNHIDYCCSGGGGGGGGGVCLTVTGDNNVIIEKENNNNNNINNNKNNNIKNTNNGVCSEDVVTKPNHFCSNNNNNNNNYAQHNRNDNHIQNQPQHSQQQQQQQQTDINNVLNDSGNNSTSSTSSSSSSSLHQKSNLTNTADALPWDKSFHEIDAPIVCQRFADNKFNHVNSSRNNYHHPSFQTSHDISPLSDDTSSIKNCTNIENLKTREIMQNIPPSAIYRTSPDERLKQINKRLVACKKRLENFEDTFERQNGYKPSQSEKLNDHYMKNTISEIHKLRKERQMLKNDPMAAMGLKVTQNGGNKIVKMKETIVDIEHRLQEKRVEDNRSIVLEDLSPDQLLQEKTDLQKGLLYYESLFGRPHIPDERDIARNLYDRYRLIKRLVNRSASLQSSSIVVPPELPTILEHEAMVFTAAVELTTSSSDINSPTDSSLILSPDGTTTATTTTATTTATTIVPDDHQTIDTKITTSTTTTTIPADIQINDNIHTLSLDELFIELENAREDKRKMGSTIKEFEQIFEERNGRKMLKSDRIIIEDTYAIYKQKKAKLRLLDALVKKHMSSK